METNTIDIDGETFTRELKGKRAVIVITGGWIYAGDVSEKDGRIRLTNAVWVFKWSEIGFTGVLANPEKADIRPMEHCIDLPKASEIYRVPVKDGWGFK